MTENKVIYEEMRKLIYLKEMTSKITSSDGKEFTLFFDAILMGYQTLAHLEDCFDNRYWLYCERRPVGPREVFLRCLDSTIRPDGARREYLLRVPPDMSSCQEALSWTFDMEPGEYNPIAES